MWMICALLTFLCWGTADLFYKIGNKQEGNYNHLKTGIFVGLVMGIHATIYMLVKDITFNWIESNRKRDLDNVAFAKKFILDALVKCGKMKDDNRNYVLGFVDEFFYSNETKVILKIEEVGIC